MTEAERQELEHLREQDQLHGLGDRPSALAVATIRRIIELEDKERAHGLPNTDH